MEEEGLRDKILRDFLRRIAAAEHVPGAVVRKLTELLTGQDGLPDEAKLRELVEEVAPEDAPEEHPHQ
jgi:hypothetical protein